MAAVTFTCAGNVLAAQDPAAGIQKSATAGINQAAGISLPQFAALDIPASPQAIPTGFDSCRLSWTAVTGATGYALYRSTSPDSGFAYIKTITATKYKNIGLATGTTYYYKVRAYAIVDATKTYGEFSAVIGVTPVPSTPAGPQAVSAGYDSSMLSWSAVPGATGYVLYRSTSPDSGFTYIKTTDTTYYTNTGLTTGTMYYYLLKAYTLVNTTKVYSINTDVFRVQPVPATPASPQAVSDSNSSSTISWSAVAGATGYSVYRSTDAAGGFSYLRTAASTTYMDTGLTAGTTYYYEVKAYTMVGAVKINSLFSSVVSATVAADPVPSDFVNYCLSFIGVPYVWAGESTSGFDCSGYVLYVYKNYYGISLPHQSNSIAGQGTGVSAADIQVGDVVCYDYSGDGVVDHVSIYIGNGAIVHASSSNGKVVQGTLYTTSVTTIRRFL